MISPDLPGIPPAEPQPESQPTPPERRTIPLRDFWTRLSLSNLQIILVILTVIGGRLMIDFGQRIWDGQKKVSQLERLEADIQELQYQQQRLEELKAYYSSPAYIQVWAHSDGKMVLPGEKIVIPLYKGQPRPRRTPLPEAAPEALPKWATWWTLFFDSPPPIPQDGSSTTTP